MVRLPFFHQLFKRSDNAANIISRHRPVPVLLENPVKMRVVPGQRKYGSLRPEILIEFRGNVLLAETMHPMQKQKRVDRLHPFEHPVSPTLAGNRIGFETPEDPHDIRREIRECAF